MIANTPPENRTVEGIRTETCECVTNLLLEELNDPVAARAMAFDMTQCCGKFNRVTSAYLGLYNENGRTKAFWNSTLGDQWSECVLAALQNAGEGSTTRLAS